MSSCIIMGKLFLMLTTMLRKDQLHLTNFIYSFGQASTQFLVPFLVNYFFAEQCLNCSVLLVGALLLHIIPITLIIMDGRVPKLKPKITLKHEAANESRYSDISAISFDFYDIKSNRFLILIQPINKNYEA